MRGRGKEKKKGGGITERERKKFFTSPGNRCKDKRQVDLLSDTKTA